MDDFISGWRLVWRSLIYATIGHLALKERGFQLRNYSSYSKELLEQIPRELVEEFALRSFEEEGYNRTVLGVTFNTSIDSYGIKANIDSVFQC